MLGKIQVLRYLAHGEQRIVQLDLDLGYQLLVDQLLGSHPPEILRHDIPEIPGRYAQLVSVERHLMLPGAVLPDQTHELMTEHLPAADLAGGSHLLAGNVVVQAHQHALEKILFYLLPEILHRAGKQQTGHVHPLQHVLPLVLRGAPADVVQKGILVQVIQEVRVNRQYSLDHYVLGIQQHPHREIRTRFADLHQSTAKKKKLSTPPHPVALDTGRNLGCPARAHYLNITAEPACIAHQRLHVGLTVLDMGSI